MALDHFVPQVHLRQFLSPQMGHLLHAFDKVSDKYFTPRPNDVCRLESGNSNDYLQDPRSIEQFLKTVEPRYVDAVAGLRSARPTRDAIYVVAAFAAYIMTCSPLATRIQSLPARDVVEHALVTLDGAGALPESPNVFDGRSVRDLLRDGVIQIDLDDQFPRAMAASAIADALLRFGNGRWEILRTDPSKAPFLTSDYPAAIAGSRAGDILVRVVPLAPDIAVRICPVREGPLDRGFSGFRYCVTRATREQVMATNRSIVQCADKVVISMACDEWLPKFVKKHSGYCLRMISDHSGEGGIEKRIWRYAIVRT